MTRDEWLALAERCEKAEGPEKGCAPGQRPIDWSIYKAVFAGVEGFSGSEVNFPRYTASLDAITALIERELPGFLWKVSSIGPNGLLAHAHIEKEFLNVENWWHGAAATPALALCAALCRAKAEMVESNNG
jgi:hypothetical protein